MVSIISGIGKGVMLTEALFRTITFATDVAGRFMSFLANLMRRWVTRTQNENVVD